MAYTPSLVLTTAVIPTASLTPTKRTSPSSTSAPQETPTAPSSPAVMPTLTLVPSLPVREAEARVHELLENNGGCRLPCWWGITPGKTTVRAVLSSLYALRDIANAFLFDELGGGMVVTVPQNDVLMNISVTIREQKSDPHPEIIKGLTVNLNPYPANKDESTATFPPPSYAQQYYYTLPYLLSTYGPPSNVATMADVDAGQYLLYLDYHATGWTAQLEMPLERRGNLVGGCPVETYSTTLWLWSPDNPEKQVLIGSPYIDETNSLTLEDFYQQFKDFSNTRCLEAPLDVYRR